MSGERGVAKELHRIPSAISYMVRTLEESLDLQIFALEGSSADGCPRLFDIQGTVGHRIWLSDFHSKRLALNAGAGHGWMPLHLVEEDLEAGRLVQPKTEGGDEWTYHPEWVHLKSRPLGRAGLGVAQGVENSMKAPRTAGL